VLLSRLWPNWRQTVQIAQPDTVARWHRRGWRLYWRWKSRPRRPGRPGVPRAVQALIRQMCRANPTWGAPRIHDELLTLGIAIAETTVGHYLVRPRSQP
jgi:putative transposase